MNLRQMEVFQAVMQEGTVTDAARLLGLSQPSVTEMLRHTEAKLGFRLFDRIRGRLRPTPEAQLLCGEVEGIFERVRVLHRSFDALRDARLGSLTIATISALGLSFAPELLGRFLAPRPDVQARLLVKRRFDLVGSIVTEGADLGFSFLSGNDPRITRREIARRGLVCIFPAGHALGRLRRVAIGDLAPWPVVTYASTQGLAAVVNGLFTGAGVAPRTMVEVEDIAQAWSVVRTGIGVSVVDPFSDLGRMFPEVEARPLDSAVSLSLDALLPHQKPVSGLTEAFLAHVAVAARQAAPGT